MKPTNTAENIYHDDGIDLVSVWHLAASVKAMVGIAQRLEKRILHDKDRGWIGGGVLQKEMLDVDDIAFRAEAASRLSDDRIIGTDCESEVKLRYPRWRVRYGE